MDPKQENEMQTAERVYRLQQEKVVQLRADLAKAIANRITLEKQIEQENDDVQRLAMTQHLSQLLLEEQRCRIAELEGQFVSDRMYFDWLLSGWKFTGKKASKMERHISDTKEKAQKYQAEAERLLSNGSLLEHEWIVKCQQQQEHFVERLIEQIAN